MLDGWGMTTVEMRRAGQVGTRRPGVLASLVVSVAANMAWALLAPVTAKGEYAQLNETVVAQVAELDLLSIDDEATRFATNLPLTREIGVSGVVSEALALSLAEAGVPAVVLLEARQALAKIVDLDREIGVGDRFYLRYRQDFTVEGARVGTPLLLWVELRTTGKGTIALHRFRPSSGPERLWHVNGEAAGRTLMRLPLDIINVSSGFGLRLDPLDKPGPAIGALGDLPNAGASPGSEQQLLTKGELATTSRLPIPDGLAALARDVSESRRPKHRGVGPLPDSLPQPQPERRTVEAPTVPRAKPRLFMHEGLDLVAAAGTPIYAAADGLVISAGPNGRYGNWMQINHAGKVTTVYGHLSEFAPGIKVGTPVSYGELIGFVGSTGRSTGAHLHFEILVDGRPVNPSAFPAIKRLQLSGAELDRFHKQVQRSHGEREHESK
jgi:murein DD-endopeptidase MepM/ murein hydrolase activator NlpD